MTEQLSLFDEPEPARLAPAVQPLPTQPRYMTARQLKQQLAIGHRTGQKWRKRMALQEAKRRGITL